MFCIIKAQRYHYCLEYNSRYTQGCSHPVLAQQKGFSVQPLDILEGFLATPGHGSHYHPGNHISFGQRTEVRLTMQEMQETQVQSLGREDFLEKEMATHSSSLA